MGHTAHGKIETVKLKQTIKKLLKPWNKLSLTKRVVLLVSFLVLAGYGLIFGLSKPVDFAYSGRDCVRQLTLFPSVMKQVNESGFATVFSDTVTVGGYPVASLRTCFVPTQAPEPGKTIVSVSPFGSWFMAKQFAVNVSEAPAVKISDFVDKTLPVTRPVEIGLDGPDEVFEYKFTVGDKSVDCEHKDSTLHCDIEALGLAQGETYQASLARYFNGEKMNEIGKGDIITLKALTPVGASVSSGQTIYDKPASFVFEYDKKLDVVEATLTTKEGQPVEITTSIDDKKAVVTPKAELTRNAEFTLTLKKVEAVDGSALAEPAVVPFIMSGGPKVTGISIGSTGVALGGTITITFDQDVANFSAVSSIVSIAGIQAQLSGNGKRLIISYSANICADFSIVVKKGLKSPVDVVQEDEWKFNGRTICYSVQTIGYSVQGRAINAFVFGSGSKTILYTGAIHGNEQSSRLLMNAWISELDANARSIPAGTQIVVIPSVNPDGVAANTRANANNVDLNRNYDTSDWQTDVQTVNGDPYPGGGGSAPGSEPETQALMAYTTALAPALTMSYHSSASYAIANQCGNSASLAQTYANLTGYSNMTGVSGAFSYQITGTYDDWICERLGRASILIELSTSYSAEFARNKAALWAMARS